MLVDFSKTFFPTIEEKIESYENLLKIHISNIGLCSTCRHYVCSDSSDSGHCDLKYEHVFLLQRFRCQSDDACKHFEYDDEFKQLCINEIKELRKAKEMAPKPQCSKCRDYRLRSNESGEYFCAKGYYMLKNKKGEDKSDEHC